MFVRLPQGKVFLATIDMVGPVSSTPRYSGPPSRIRTQNTRSRAPPERPRQNSAGQVTSNSLFRNFARHPHETASLLGVAVITTFMLTLGPLLSLALCLRACGRTRLPSRGLGAPPLIGVAVASVLVLVLVVLVWLGISTSSLSTLVLVLSFPTTFCLALAGVVAFASATALARAFARIFTLQLRRKALLVVALILLVLPLPIFCSPKSMIFATI